MRRNLNPNRQAQAALLFLLGATVLHAGLTDLHLRYVKAGLRPLLLLCGAVLVVTAMATVWYEWREASGKRDHDESGNGSGDGSDGGGESGSDGGGESGSDGGGESGNGGGGDGGGGEHDHDRGHHEPRISWLLALPVLALILVAPPALGSYSATHTGTALQKPFGFPELPAGGTLRLGVGEYAARAVYDDGRGLGDRPIEITGFVALDPSGVPYLVRMSLNCCAADGQPVKIALTGEVPPVLQPDAWLEVTGTYSPRRTKDPVNDGPVPYFEVTSAKPVPTPNDPYDEVWNG
ncbi:TIGR03943 family protein [Streptomyces sp. NBC_01635]|uniref:TIGR03943 family putative permease subunit n=1 Tax=Streptomyces sp. NBC_01635 TaxID=2975904 RepID=UPI00386DD15B|nr:TIGR03943 family protein [Streptomyces sp. NBC_01635]